MLKINVYGIFKQKQQAEQHFLCKQNSFRAFVYKYILKIENTTEQEKKIGVLTKIKKLFNFVKNWLNL